MPRTAHKIEPHPVHRYVVRRAPRRNASSETKRDSSLVALFSLGPYDRNQLTRTMLDQLRNWIDNEGTPKVAKELEVSEVTLLRACAGFGHRLQPKTAAKLRRYFNINAED